LKKIGQRLSTDRPKTVQTTLKVIDAQLIEVIGNAAIFYAVSDDTSAVGILILKNQMNSKKLSLHSCQGNELF
jgi:hypothetical protein